LFHSFSSKDQNITNVLDSTLSRLNAKDPTILQKISDHAGTTDPAEIESYRLEIIAEIQDAKEHIASDPKSKIEDYASRDPFIGLVQTNMGEEAHALGAPALANLANDWQQYGDADLRWALCPIVSFFTSRVPKHPFVGSPDPDSYEHVEWKPKFTIALMADWGAANDNARQISSLIKEKQPDYVIHLGDVYYAGTKAECQSVLKMWPLVDASGAPMKDRSFALNGNHEMFCGARDYFETILAAFNQGASYFRLITEYWQFIGLDTAYTGGSLSHPETQVQWEWLVANLNRDRRTAILLTHHQPVSAHSQETQDSKALRDDFAKLQTQTRKDAVYGWFFGHEHRAAVYDDTVTGYKARLIGNGAVPHDAQQETAPEKGCTPFTCVNTGTWGSGNAISSFVLLTVEGPKLTVEYIDQSGKPSSIPTEVWQATCPKQPLP
jgi:Calcineurin-like phosphoesterase